MSDDQHLLSPFTPRDVTAYEAKSVVAETPADVEAEMADAVIRGEATKHYVSVSARWLKAFLDDVWRNGRPAFKLRTLGDDTGKTAVHVHREDLDAAYRTLPPHIAKRNRDLQDLTENHEATMAGAFSTRGSHLQEMIEMRDQEEAGARRRPDGSDEAASRAGLAFLLGAFGKEHDAAIKIQRAWRAFLLRRGPMDPNRMKQPHEKKIHHHYWEPLKREANLTKVDLLDRSREALKHAESAVARIERQKK